LPYRASADLRRADHQVLARPRRPVLPAPADFADPVPFRNGRRRLRPSQGPRRKWLHDLVETSSEQLAAWGEKERSTALYSTITVLSGLTLFLELMLIRWQGSLFPVFALYKNFTLLACFCGLGIGYALAHRRPLLLPMTLPLLALTIFLLISLRYASLGDIFFFVPVKEETSVFDLHNMLPEWASAALNIPAYLLLIVTFILNVLIMVPVAQFCGHVMLRANTLAGYGCNLLCSIAGVGLLFLLSWLWTGPVIWFAVAAALLLAYQLVSYELPLERNNISASARPWPASSSPPIRSNRWCRTSIRPISSSRNRPNLMA
jgi:hypothetical protein